MTARCIYVIVTVSGTCFFKGWEKLRPDYPRCLPADYSCIEHDSSDISGIIPQIEPVGNHLDTAAGLTGEGY
jgi:hypothetical protein